MASNTIVDFPKVTQMLDAGWKVELWKNGLRMYSACATHEKQEIEERAVQKLCAQVDAELVATIDADDWLTTDDFTPEQALTRLAYKVHGEILDSQPKADAA